MDMKDSLVKGAVLIAHKIHEGKHQYVVENVVKYKMENEGKLYVRKGDKLLQINGMDLNDLTPEELAEMIAEGSPMLTVCKPAKEEDHTEQTSLTEDTLQPVSKEPTLLSFSWKMTREDDPEGTVVEPQEEEKETVNIEEDLCQAKTEENEMFVVEMTKTSISLVRGRGCDKTGCTFNDIIMVAESSTVTLVPRGGGSFRQEKLSNVLIENLATRQYLRGICSEKIVYASPNPEKITIYYYKSSGFRRGSSGMPVVLNLTDSNCFLMCCKQADRVFLKVETCERQRLKQISKSDESTLSFVFYMKGDSARRRRFESALYSGWFINVCNTDTVGVATLDGHTVDQSFLFIIQK
ncbi:interleukin-1 family member A [Simochromis diagramma]|uniref:interleukin-1 family member A n=1 Tax=Simochromis diagramma TaxID=43689 RepID=UPI001A7ED680|nr:interleukin-1 family member A [Simochromis diagramma]